MKKKYVHRQLEQLLLKCTAQFPVLVLTGPRQTGKSTLLKTIFSHYNYVSLDELFQREQAQNDPVYFLENIGKQVIIDEIQYAPNLLSYIKIQVDNNRQQNGMYILTGSQYFPLMAGISESLAGRACVFELLGMSIEEQPIPHPASIHECFDFFIHGFYPDTYIHKVDHRLFYNSYLQTYLERDVRQLLNIRDLKAFQTFIELLAARVGSLLNLNEISKECGITSGTAKSWVSLLESTRIILLLRPYAKNISKRVIKSPKIYFTDTGLLLYILRYMTGEMVLNSPLSGNIFENFLIIEFFKHKLNHQYMYEMYYYRDSNHNEIDLVLEFADHTKLCEIKIARTLNKNFISTIKNQLALFTNPTGYLLSFAEQSLKMDERIYAKPWSAIFKELIET